MGMRARWVAVGFGALLAGQAVLAQPLGLPPGRWWERPRIADELGLTAEQAKTLETVTVDHAHAMIDLKAAVDRAEGQLRMAADAEPFDAVRVRAGFQALQLARGKLEGERFELLIQVRQTLTPSQWALLQRMAKERREAMGSEAAPLRPRRRF